MGNVCRENRSIFVSPTITSEINTSTQLKVKLGLSELNLPAHKTERNKHVAPSLIYFSRSKSEQKKRRVQEHIVISNFLAKSVEPFLSKIVKVLVESQGN